MADNIQQLKEAGYSDSEISEWVAGKRKALSDAGFNEGEIDKYFGTVKQPSVSDQVIDVLKQIPSGLLSVAEQAPGLGPSMMRAAGQGIDVVREKLGFPKSEAERALEAQQASRRAAGQQIQAQTLPSRLLPQSWRSPTTPAGEVARTVTEFGGSVLATKGRNLIREPVARIATQVGTQGVIPALASEAVGRAPGIEGTDYEGAARIYAALFAGFPFGRWRQPMHQGMLSDELFEAGRLPYRQIEEMDLKIDTRALGELGNRMAEKVGRGLPDAMERIIPETWGVIRDLQRNLYAREGSFATTANIDAARSTLQLASQSRTNGREAFKAWEAIGVLDDWLANLPQSAVLKGDAQAAAKLFKEGRDYWAAAKRVQAVEGAINLGEFNTATAHSAENADNATRQAVKLLIKPRVGIDGVKKSYAEQHGFSKNEIKAMEEVAKGTPYRNTVRYFANLLGKGHGSVGPALTAGVLGAAGEAGGFGESGKEHSVGLGLAGAAAGLAFNKYGAALARREAKRMQMFISQRNPSMQQGAWKVPTDNEIRQNTAVWRGAIEAGDKDWRDRYRRDKPAEPQGYGGPI